jgi:hypothetical protein
VAELHTGGKHETQRRAAGKRCRAQRRDSRTQSPRDRRDVDLRHPGETHRDLSSICVDVVVDVGWPVDDDAVVAVMRPETRHDPLLTLEGLWPCAREASGEKDGDDR